MVVLVIHRPLLALSIKLNIWGCYRSRQMICICSPRSSRDGVHNSPDPRPGYNCFSSKSKKAAQSVLISSIFLLSTPLRPSKSLLSKPMAQLHRYKYIAASSVARELDSLPLLSSPLPPPPPH
ncbi:hypothetical protein L211DRAFT_249894 [Terfezia boudieri ATCC MYA-4762]|uniref:Uncharacterized protein n=1 Tax=Terfezia boudieri ATCC MYA-4762 TaxID=1051890 RepID=A0A3N4M870_9PEZI|nr:hypothetical protein L211DRAFT_249894 [Terfezia boudieri ATCC MYA-4762]